VFLGGEQRFFFDKPSLDDFLAHEEASRGEELKVADEQATTTAVAPSPTAIPTVPPEGAGATTADGEAAGEPEAETDAALQVLDLHEVRQINQTLRTLKEYGVTAANFLTGVNKAGEPVYPWAIKGHDGDVPLSSLRELLPEIRKMGEKGLRLTRFKGLGEMDPEELWTTSMDADSRLLLQVTMEDAAAADEIFRVLMGDHVEPRREFIEKHALEVKDLDI
jgi:DNA gyrase subunit B